VSGTSFSAPTTAGIYGLIFAVNPGLSPADADDILFSTVDDLGAAGWDTYYGWGRVNAAKAVAKAKNYVPTSDTIAPTAPTGLTASALSATSVSLSWGASNDLKGVSGYRVYRDGNEIAQVTFGTAYTDTKVVAQTTYVYTVKAYDTSNNLSSSSNAATVTTPVQPFAVMTVGTSNQTASSANINWTTSAPSTGVVKYGTSQGALTLTVADMVSGTSHQVVVSGLKRKTKYYFQVEATSEDGTKKAVSAIQTFMTRNR
jgi:chitodextrinase